MILRRRCLLGLAVAAAWAVAGCDGGDGLPRRAVSGTVRLDGEPLGDGRIEFQPVGPGVPAWSIVERGSYRVAASTGPTPGRYRVIISAAGEVKGGAAEERAPGEPPGRAGPVPVERIPSRYNAASTLTAEVKAEGVNEFDFTLDSSPGPGQPALRK